MTATAAVLLAYALLTLLLVTIVGVIRTLKVQLGGRDANSFTPTGDDLGSFGKRLTRAHANCYENLPVAAAVLLYAIATHQTALTDGLAYWFLAARLAQSITHAASTSNIAVLFRFGFYLAQNVILVIWIIRLFGIS